MPTIKKRINITADPEIESALKHAAKRDGLPIAAKAAELLTIGLQLEEDIALAAVADMRNSKKVRRVSHEKAWK